MNNKIKIALFGLILCSGVPHAATQQNIPDNQPNRTTEQTDPHMQYLVGSAYFHGHSGMPVDRELAYEWLSKSAKQDYPQALTTLGIGFMNGSFGYVEHLKGLSYLNRAAELKEPIAMDVLASLYEEGNIIAKDPKKAAQYAADSAALNYNRGQFTLARYYYDGFGVKQDHKRSKVLYKQSCDNGYQDACTDLQRRF